MAEVRHTEVFDCTPQQFFNLITDYESYPEFLSEVQECQVLTEQDGVKKVSYQVSVMKTFQYTNEHIEKAPNQVQWTFQSGDLFKTMHGHWLLSEEGGKTKAEYFVEATFGRFVPKMMTKTVLSVNLPAMMKAYHQRVKELYGGSGG